MTGIMVAALVTFFAGRLLRRDTVRLAGRKLDRLSAVLRQRGLLAMTAVRLVPLAPFPVVGLVAGAIRVKLWHYTLGTFLGNLPGVLAATVFADQIAATLDDSARILVGGRGGDRRTRRRHGSRAEMAGERRRREPAGVRSDANRVTPVRAVRSSLQDAEDVQRNDDDDGDAEQPQANTFHFALLR